MCVGEVLVGLGFPFIVCGKANHTTPKLQETYRPGSVGGASVAPDDWTGAKHMMGGERFIYFLVVSGWMASLVQPIEVADLNPNPY